MATHHKPVFVSPATFALLPKLQLHRPDQLMKRKQTTLDQQKEFIFQ